LINRDKETMVDDLLIYWSD